MKFVFVCNSVGIAYRFRLPIIIDLISQGHDVVIATFRGFEHTYYAKKLERHGLTLIYLDGADRALSPLRLFKAAMKLRRLVRDYDADVVHSFTHVANLVAFCSVFGSRRHLILNLTGAGIIFTQSGCKALVYQRLVYAAYFVMGFKASAICFQNPDDLLEFRKSARLKADKLFLTNGSGFDDNILCDVKAASLGQSRAVGDTYAGRIKVLFPARLLFHKGIVEFLDAARQLVEQGARFEFFIAGQEVHDGALGLSRERIQELAGGNAEYLGFRKDILAVMAAVDVIVLPSYYREGIPRTLIEALALGKPIITADSPGCRETVVDGRNGFLTEPRSAKELVHALLRLEESDIPTFGRRSRRLFDEKFRVDKIIQAYHTCYASVLEG